MYHVPCQIVSPLFILCLGGGGVLLFHIYNHHEEHRAHVVSFHLLPASIISILPTRQPYPNFIHNISFLVTIKSYLIRPNNWVVQILKLSTFLQFHLLDWASSGLAISASKDMYTTRGGNGVTYKGEVYAHIIFTYNYESQAWSISER